MSRFGILAKDGTKVVYGYDRVLSYYFLDTVDADGDFEHRVGMLSCPEVYGSARNLLEMCDKLGVNLPAAHRFELEMDLPLSDPPKPMPEDCSGIPDPDGDPPGWAVQFDSSLDQWGVG